MHLLCDYINVMGQGQDIRDAQKLKLLTLSNVDPPMKCGHGLLTSPFT